MSLPLMDMLLSYNSQMNCNYEKYGPKGQLKLYKRKKDGEKSGFLYENAPKW